MQLIQDGYSETHSRHCGRDFLYRPMIAEERAGLREMHELPEDLFCEFVVDCVKERIVLCGWNVYGLAPTELMHIFEIVTGTGRDAEERADAENLAAGARLALQYPHLADPAFDCRSCQHYLYNPLEGRLFRDSAGEPVKRDGPTLCQTPQGCPKGTPESPIRFSEKNAQAFRHWQAWQGTGCGLNDAIVRRNARIIEHAREYVRSDQTAHERAVEGSRQAHQHGHARGRGPDIGRRIVRGNLRR